VVDVLVMMLSLLVISLGRSQSMKNVSTSTNVT
jgi:hypothetical protein